MNSKKLNVVGIILHIVLISLLFVQGMFYCYLSGESYQRVNNAFTDLPSGSVLPIIFVVLSILSLFLCLLWALSKKKKKFNVMHTLLPIAAFLVFLFIGFLYSVGEYATLVEQLTVALNSGSSAYAIGIVFYIESATLLSIIVIAIIKRKYYSECNVADEKENVKEKSVESLDMLIKYKELLNEGIITQEEFEEKKKELL